MSQYLPHLFDSNRRWAARMEEARPGFFNELTHQQNPQYLWIGCSDSRVPANEIVDLLPGELFVHRNVANLVVNSDMNCLSVLQYAVENLRVKHVIVCGHYGCGGVRAALEARGHGLVDNWLRHVRSIYLRNRAEIDALPDQAAQINRLCELNVLEQATNLANTTIVQGAWAAGQELTVHSWVYDLADGLLRDLKLTMHGPADVPGS